jgi:hypothetical protein
VNLKTKLAKVSKDLVGAITRVEEERPITREDGGPEHKGRGVPLAARIFRLSNLHLLVRPAIFIIRIVDTNRTMALLLTHQRRGVHICKHGV